MRPAKAGEKLDDARRRRTANCRPDNLVIADTAGPIALAGVMGGLETEVTDATKTILLESASFDFVSVRKTARQFNLFSEASTRFSRGRSPGGRRCRRRSGRRNCSTKHAGGEVLAGVVDDYPAPIPPQTIELNRSEIERLLGFDIPGRRSRAGADGAAIQARSRRRGAGP